jgi:hypothetical protein
MGVYNKRKRRPGVVNAEVHAPAKGCSASGLVASATQHKLAHARDIAGNSSSSRAVCSKVDGGCRGPERRCSRAVGRAVTAGSAGCPGDECVESGRALGHHDFFEKARLR